jgi:hypothetical protein
MNSRSLHASIMGLLCLASLAASAASHVWTCTDGRTISGEFVRMTGTAATIKKADGNTISIPLARMNAESQALAQRLASGEEAPADEAKPAAAAEAAPPAIGGGTTTPPATKSNGGGASDSARRAVGLPTDAEIAAFQKEAQLPGKPEKYVFEASAGQRILSTPDEKAKYARSGKIPFRVTMELNEIKIVNGKPLSKRMEGRGGILILDETGAIVDRKKDSLGKFCPS